jgi:hypothetical protein
MPRCFSVIAIVLLAVSTGRIAAQDEPDFERLFDGRSLEGWESPDLSYWSIEDEAITGRITAAHPCSINQYLVWKGGDLGDFELKLKSRVRGDGAVNSGFQFRSRLLPDHDIAGYQVDNNLQTDWLVRLYDEFGRHTLAWRGQETIINPDGQFSSTDLPDRKTPAWFKLEEWHEYDLLAEGPKLTLKVDGRLAAHVEDNDPRRQDFSGVLGLQLHSGGPSTVQFKDIRLKVLKKPKPRLEPTKNPAREMLLNQAVARWDLGTGGHGAQPPLVYHGSLEHCELDVLADGPSSTPNARVAVLRGGWFDTGKAMALEGSELTIFIRARDPRSLWNSTLIASRSKDHLNFHLFGSQQGTTPEPHLTFELQAERGSATVSFPLTSLEPAAWHDLVARYDGHRLELLCDGKRMAEKSFEGGNLKMDQAPLLIGAEMDGGKATNFFHGELQEVALWNKWITLP